MNRFYIAIADVHGDLIALNDALDASEDWIMKAQRKGIIGPKDVVQYVFLGDYIDRGPDPKGVLTKIESFYYKNNVIVILGNHDMMLLGTAAGVSDFYNGRYTNWAETWQINDGLSTCRRMYGDLYGDLYGHHYELLEHVSAYSDLIKNSKEYAFLRAVGKMYHETDLIYFCHAPQSNPKEMNDDTRVWGRSTDYSHSNKDAIFKVPGDNMMSVHGHIHRLNEKINFPRFVNYIHGGINKTVVLADCGCGYSFTGIDRLHPVVIKEVYDVETSLFVRTEVEVVL